MAMFRFEKYYEPRTVDECASLLNQYGSEAKMIAGGTDLVPKLKNRILKVKTVIGLQNIPQLHGINISEDKVEIGALTTLSTISKSEKIRENWPALAKSAGHVSSMQIRNMATIGGNVCNASPSADAVQGLIVSDAVVNVAGKNSTRQVPIIDFFTGVGKTVLKEGEFVVSFSIPKQKKNTGSTYEKFAIRGDTDISIVGVGSSLTLDDENKVSDVILSLSAVAPTPIRVKEVEELLVGKNLTDELINQSAEIAASSCSPITDQRATKEYRVEMVKVWTKNALKEALKNAK